MIQAILSVFYASTILLSLFGAGYVTILLFPSLLDAFKETMTSDSRAVYSSRRFLVNTGHIRVLILLSFLMAIYSFTMLVFYVCGYLSVLIPPTDSFIESSQAAVKEALASQRNNCIFAIFMMLLGTLQTVIGKRVLDRHDRSSSGILKFEGGSWKLR